MLNSIPSFIRTYPNGKPLGVSGMSKKTIFEEKLDWYEKAVMDFCVVLNVIGRIVYTKYIKSELYLRKLALNLVDNKISLIDFDHELADMGMLYITYERTESNELVLTVDFSTYILSIPSIELFNRLNRYIDENIQYSKLEVNKVICHRRIVGVSDIDIDNLYFTTWSLFNYTTINTNKPVTLICDRYKDDVREGIGLNEANTILYKLVDAESLNKLTVKNIDDLNILVYFPRIAKLSIPLLTMYIRTLNELYGSNLYFLIDLDDMYKVKELVNSVNGLEKKIEGHIVLMEYDDIDYTALRLPDSFQVLDKKLGYDGIDWG